MLINLFTTNCIALLTHSHIYLFKVTLKYAFIDNVKHMFTFSMYTKYRPKGSHHYKKNF